MSANWTWNPRHNLGVKPSNTLKKGNSKAFRKTRNFAFLNYDINTKLASAKDIWSSAQQASYMVGFNSRIGSVLLLICCLLHPFLPSFNTPKLGFFQTILEKLRSKLNDDDEFRNFEDFEIYKIVFDDPPLITAGDGDDNEGVSIMENVAAVKVTITEGDKPEEERSLESLFEELDRFEDSTVATERESLLKSHSP
ncbi:hypothetical protein L2E82_04207 [Cichorium intybus]|uniref:Uncharacterized protein n=1 Tax=Cichorium intybus TaxID=13427 RepID=A0ACB9H7A5_CICIN|nr:hypothetical protein L2E82_04207 [Cichorium intybus]